ncbi:hypothetical protein KI387_018430, partial [Taxus chinensis]
SLDGVMPHEAWSKWKPSVAHLRVFMFKVNMHIPKKNRKKMDMKSQNLIFIGYSEDNIGYRLMDPKTRRVYTSRDVEFFDKKEAESPPLDSPDVDSSPVLKIEVDVPLDDEIDDGDDGDDLIEPRPIITIQHIPNWYTSMLRDARMDAPSDTSTPGPWTH